MNLFSRLRRRRKFERQGQLEPAIAEAPQPNMRWLIRRDMPEVLIIENASFPASARWDDTNFLTALRRRNTIGMVTEHNQRILGYVIYELHDKLLRITNFAVDPAFRRTGIGQLMMTKMVEKLSQQRRNRIVILLPDECAEARDFFYAYGEGMTSIQTTDQKGRAGLDIVVKPMKSKHVVRVQRIEDNCVKEPRNIGSMLGRGTMGAIAHNTRGIEGDDIVGYVLWEEDAESSTAPLVVNGAIGQITHPDFMHRGVERALMRHIAALGRPIIVSDIDLKDKDRCHFLRDIGVPVPELSRYMTVEWRPTAATA